MISDADLKEIKLKPPNHTASYAHVQAGVPIPKAMRVRAFSPGDWEEFIEEWAISLGSSYAKVCRFGGSGDFGVDIAGFYSEKGFEGAWDNYQCKRYRHPLRPSDVWVEIGKIIYYAFRGEYTSPRKHYFVCSQGIGTQLAQLLNKSTTLKQKTAENWEKYCRLGITSKYDIVLSGDLLKFFNQFDFAIFSSKSHVDLINAHGTTGYHAVRFGGGLPARPGADTPPDTPAVNESRYLRQLLDAYGDYLGSNIADLRELDEYNNLKRDCLRQRERFYHAESLRNFARDTVPEGTFTALQEEIFHGVVDIVEGNHDNGFVRMKATVAQATSVAVTANPLASATKAQDRQGICHQLANDDRLIWVPDHD